MVVTLGVQMWNVNFVKTVWTGFSIVWHSATNNVLPSNTQSCLQGNIIKVNCIWEHICNDFALISLYVWMLGSLIRGKTYPTEVWKQDAEEHNWKEVVGSNGWACCTSLWGDTCLQHFVRNIWGEDSTWMTGMDWRILLSLKLMN